MCSGFSLVNGLRLSWSETAEALCTSWDTVYSSVQWVVAYSKGHQYMTLVYQIDDARRRLFSVGKDRCEDTLRGIFDQLGVEVCSGIEVVCSDMWKAYLNVIPEKKSDVLNILDRFHIVNKLNEAVDNVCREVVKR